MQKIVVVSRKFMAGALEGLTIFQEYPMPAGKKVQVGNFYVVAKPCAGSPYTDVVVAIKKVRKP